MPNAFHTKNYHQGQVIFRKGQDGFYAYLINQGSVEVCREGKDQKVTLAVLWHG
ncbi:hypothetical protein DFAR_2050007 [Desulfarculales bacterium]